MNVIDTKNSERDAGGKPGATFPHPALEHFRANRILLRVKKMRKNKPLELVSQSTESASAPGSIFGGVLSACVLICLAAAPCANAVDASGSYVAVGASTTVPFGWADFCRRYDGECDIGREKPVDINLTPKTIKQIQRINKWVNESVEPRSDAEQWEMVDRWDYPNGGNGDCEDYALLKRRLLIAAGLPRQALLMTIVKDTRLEGHALLTIKTNAGEFVLDNLNNEIKPWDQTGYRFVKRQSQEDPNDWVQLGDPTPAPDYVSR